MPTPWQDVYSVVWGVLILRVVDIWRVPTMNPLSNTPGIASVGGKKKKKAASSKWSKLASYVSVEGIRTPFSQYSSVLTTVR
jgi:hypothetical protein